MNVETLAKQLYIETLAKQLYEAYGQNAQWQNYAGGAMPMWDSLPISIQSNWIYVARIAYETCEKSWVTETKKYNHD